MSFPSNATLLVLSLLALPAPAPFTLRPVGVEIALSREAGTRLSKTISIEQEMASEEESLTIDGEESEDMSGMERSTETRFELTFTDEVLEIEDGAVTRLVRSFDELGQTFHGEFIDPTGESQEIDGEGECPLVGHAVVFRLEDGEYVAAFAEDDDGGDEDLLAGLEPFFDLNGFLPEDEVEVGESWDVPLEVFDRLRSPLGKLPVFSEEMDDEARARAIEELGANEDTEPELEGDLEATLEAVGEEDGRRLATIALNVDVESIADLSDSIELPSGDDGEGAIHPDIESFVERRDWEGEGRLVWDLTAGHAVSLALELKTRESTEIEMSLHIFGKTQAMVQRSILAGETTLEIRFEE